MLNIAVVGLGWWGRIIVPLAKTSSRLRVVRVADPAPAAAQFAASQDLPLSKSLDEVLRDPQVEGVVLCTPHTQHTDQIVRAANAGKHVFCEKPLALDLSECRRVEAVAAQHPRLKVMIGYGRRFDPSYSDAYDKIRSGLIGTPFLVRSQNLDMNDPSGFFVRFAPTSGGIFLDCSVHDIDLARWFLGRPKPLRVFAAGTIALHEGLREFGDVDNGVATCEFEDGKLACFYASRTMAHGHESSTEIFGTKGRLAIGENPRLNRVEISDAHGVRNECTPTFYERFEEAFLRETLEFVQAVQDDRSPALTLRDATEATRIGVALRESLQTRRAVEL